jgi:hypothetical protein
MDISNVDLCNGDSEILCHSEFFTFESAAGSYIPLRRGHHRLKPSNLAPVLQYVSGTSDNFLAKLRSVDTPLFLFNTELCCPLSLLSVYKSHKSIRTYVVNDSSVAGHSGHAVWGVGIGRLVAGIVGSNVAVCLRPSMLCCHGSTAIGKQKKEKEK